MASLTVLCDVVGRYGGTERYWETVLPELARFHEVRLLARVVEEPERFGVRAEQVDWSDENSEPSARGAARVAAAIAGSEVVITANVFDARVLAAVREGAPRWIARIHDYRPFCPNGNKVFPQFPAVCTSPMGSACVANAIVRGCVRGPRIESLQRISGRMHLRDRLAHADRVLVSSGYVRGTCVKNGVAPERIRITPPPLPDDAFANGIFAPRSNAVLFFGRFNDQKGLSSLIRALGQISAPSRPPLIVAGAGDEREEHNGRMLAQSLEVDISWRGWLTQAQVRDVIDEARIVAVPSLWPEPFGLTGIEAQARGRPVVAYDVGGVSDWLTGAGIAVPRADETAFARAIERLNDADCWERYAGAARERAERFRLATHIQTMQEIVASAMQEHEGAST